ncbi:MAG: redoxin domain-containing protein [Chitinivibrionia bacterium]|nr:redoxin domain-containing protein [Chitinivibrionia bacterium]
MKKLMILLSALVLITATVFLITIKSGSGGPPAEATGSSDPQPAGSGSSDPQSGDATSQAAYEKVLEEIKTLEHSVTRETPMEQVMEVFGRVEQKLVDFASRYPGTDEAQDAKFQIGLLNANLSNVEKAKQYLEDFIANSPNAQKSKLGYAHFFLAETLMNEDKFDEAKKHYSTFIERYGDADANMLARAKASLGDMETMKNLAVGKPPIPFEVKGLDGKTISLAKYKGTVVLIDFWATWCGPCRSEMPHVISLYSEYHSKGFEIIGISLDDNKANLDTYIADNKMTWPQYYEGNKWNNSIAKRYGVRAIPATFLVDKQGNIRYKAVRGRELARAVEKLVSEK